MRSNAASFTLRWNEEGKPKKTTDFVDKSLSRVTSPRAHLSGFDGKSLVGTTTTRNDPFLQLLLVGTINDANDRPVFFCERKIGRRRLFISQVKLRNWWGVNENTPTRNVGLVERRNNSVVPFRRRGARAAGGSWSRVDRQLSFHLSRPLPCIVSSRFFRVSGVSFSLPVSPPPPLSLASYVPRLAESARQVDSASPLAKSARRAFGYVS